MLEKYLYFLCTLDLFSAQQIDHDFCDHGCSENILAYSTELFLGFLGIFSILNNSRKLAQAKLRLN